MAYQHYTTEAFILAGVPVGEAHRYLTLFTKEFGLLRAVARSVRAERSKLRYGLQTFDATRLTLVRGREVWRVTGAMLGGTGHYHFRGNRAVFLLTARLCALLRRLLHDEERNLPLFLLLSDALSYLAASSLDEERIRDVESVTVLRILALLGYRSSDVLLRDIVSTGTLDEEVFSKAAAHRSLAVAEINELLNVTQL